MALFSKRKAAVEEITVLPRHIGIIMDGNGRWAKKRGLPRQAGHVTGARVFRTIVKHCEKRGIEAVTFYAFSTENWKRPPEEVTAIMNLLRSYLKELMVEFKNENIRVRFIGDRTVLDTAIREQMDEGERLPEHTTGMVLNVAVNYGGRAELAVAARRIAEEVQAGTLDLQSIDEACVNDRLYTAGLPDVDLILRPSGEYRLSNFLIWQCAYAEYVFDEVLWPDFTVRDLDRALAVYSARNRRFGGV